MIHSIDQVENLPNNIFFFESRKKNRKTILFVDGTHKS